MAEHDYPPPAPSSPRYGPRGSDTHPGRAGDSSARAAAMVTPQDALDELVQDISQGIDGDPYLDNAGWKRAHAALKELARLIEEGE